MAWPAADRSTQRESAASWCEIWPTRSARMLFVELYRRYGAQPAEGDDAILEWGAAAQSETARTGTA